jgi:hypothetical protein
MSAELELSDSRYAATAVFLGPKRAVAIDVSRWSEKQ